MRDAAFINDCAKLYRKTLLDDVVPWWMEHGIDREVGVLYNCLDDAGNLLNRDRYLWSQGRGLWTFSALYNRIKRRPEWLDVSRGIASYLYTNGRDADGRWLYRLDENGDVLDWDISIYVDGFAMNGLGEFYKATKDPQAAELALATFEVTDRRIQTPGSYGIAPYVLPDGVKTLGIPMIFSFFYSNLGQAIGHPEVTARGRELADEILRDFLIPEKDAVMEFVRIKGGEVDSAEGRVTIPGHVLEAMWFLISIYEKSGNARMIRRCCEKIKRYVEWGWDQEYGGIRLAIDVNGHETVAWRKADCKPWWVQVEALVATAYAYLHTGEDWCVEWHRRIRDWAFSHYPVPGGEWTQWLERDGSKGETAALPVKDPFHLPRGLIYLIDLFERRLSKE